MTPTKPGWYWLKWHALGRVGDPPEPCCSDWKAVEVEADRHGVLHLTENHMSNVHTWGNPIHPDDVPRKLYEAVQHAAALNEAALEARVAELESKLEDYLGGCQDHCTLLSDYQARVEKLERAGDMLDAVANGWDDRVVKAKRAWRAARKEADRGSTS